MKNVEEEQQYFAKMGEGLQPKYWPELALYCTVSVPRLFLTEREQ